MVTAIQQRTDGNPFFSGEVMRLVVDENALSNGAPRAIQHSALIPPTVRDVLGQRLHRLTSACRRLLDIAAVIGREFGIALLAEASSLQRIELDILEEAASAHLLTLAPETPGEFRFVHALVQETLHAEFPAARRLRLHGELATTLVRVYGDHAARHPSELAHHFVQAAALSAEHLRQAMTYSWLAAQEAESYHGLGRCCPALRAVPETHGTVCGHGRPG